MVRGRRGQMVTPCPPPPTTKKILKKVKMGWGRRGQLVTPCPPPSQQKNTQNGENGLGEEGSNGNALPPPPSQQKNTQNSENGLGEEGSNGSALPPPPPNKKNKKYKMKKKCKTSKTKKFINHISEYKGINSWHQA